MERFTRLLPPIMLVVLALVLPAGASAAFSPIDRPGPKLRIDRAKLKASLDCSDGVRGAERAPVLLTPATAVDSENNFSWNYERLFADEGIPFCTTDQQGSRSTNMSNVQTRGQYVTYAIRKMFRMAGRPIAVMGHSQGGMIMRVSLRWWPDTREKVEEVIGIAGTNHGTDAVAPICLPGCSPAFWQQSSDSKFTKALNSGAETFEGISYTEIYSLLDEVVFPAERSSSVSGPGDITNVAIQDVCPTAISEHLTVGTTDPTAAALALDALNNPGPADPSRIPPSVCAQPVMPGVDPITGPGSFIQAAGVLAEAIATFPHVPEEPKLRCWSKLRKKACRQRRNG